VVSSFRPHLFPEQRLVRGGLHPLQFDEPTAPAVELQPTGWRESTRRWESWRVTQIEIYP
jgi:hypothetical protein